MTGLVIRMRACSGDKCHVMVTCIGGLIALVDTVCRFAFLPGILNNLYNASIFASCLLILRQCDSMPSNAEMSLILLLVSIGTLCIDTSCKCLLTSALILAANLYWFALHWHLLCLLIGSASTLAVSVYWYVLLWHFLQVSIDMLCPDTCSKCLLKYSALVLAMSVDILCLDTGCYVKYSQLWIY